MSAHTLPLKRSRDNPSINLNIIRNSRNPHSIIVYLHGLSSYCLEGKFLIPHLGDELSLCVYDSRAHGKNHAKLVTYGLLESEELLEVVDELVALGYKNVVLWGRSMGAVACLRAMHAHPEHPALSHVRYIVADSPFSSFSEVAAQQISQKTQMPLFLSSVLADIFANQIRTKYGVNLNDIKLSHLTCSVPVTFLYSSRD